MDQFRIIPKEKWPVFWVRAKEFHKAMQMSEDSPNATISAAVHCTISAIDALSVFKNGKRSSGEHYNSALALAEIRTSDDNERSRILNKVRMLMPLKNKGEYEDTNPSLNDARKAGQLTRDIFKFIENELRISGASPL